MSLLSILSRRSAKSFTGAVPTQDQLGALLRAAASVPDHGSMRPWRFVVVTGEGRDAFGDALAAAGPPEAQDKLRSKAFVAPTLIVLGTRRQDNPKVPVWEQDASVAAAGYAITLAAHELGLGATWKSCPVRSGAELNALLGLSADDEILGWVNVGEAEPLTGPGTAPADLSQIAGVLDGVSVRAWSS